QHVLGLVDGTVPGDQVIVAGGQRTDGTEVALAARGRVGDRTEDGAPGRAEGGTDQDNGEPGGPLGGQAEQEGEQHAYPQAADRAGARGPRGGQPPGHAFDGPQVGADDVEFLNREAVV